MAVQLAVFCMAGTAEELRRTPPKVITSVIIDDMGYYDSQPANPESPTRNLGRLAAEGIVLSRMYTYSYCSPTRRSFVTGRFPVHISGVQADVCSNWTPLGMTLLSEKLGLAGFESHFIGKSNLGYQTEDHLPVHRGFTTNTGFLYGAEDYAYGRAPLQGWLPRAFGSSGQYTGRCNRTASASHAKGCIPNCDLTAHDTSKDFDVDFWSGTAPAPRLAETVYYSTNFYTERALQILRNFTDRGFADPQAPPRLWLHLCYQAVHSPFEEVPWWERSSAPFWNDVYRDMLFVMDAGVGNLTTELMRSNLWNDTLIIAFSDNGGPSSEHGPNNYPLRGSKETAWEGGTRVFAIVSGGYLPPNLRGTRSDAFIHVADWYVSLPTGGVKRPHRLTRGHQQGMQFNLFPHHKLVFCN